MGWGWAAIGIGAIMLTIGIFMPALSDAGSAGYGGYGYRPPTINAWKWPLQLLGGGLMNLGTLLAIAGYIVRAIYFLPGREVTGGDIGQVAYTPVPASEPTPASADTAANDSSPMAGGAVSQQDGDKIVYWMVGIVAVVALALFIAIGAAAGSKQSESSPSVSSSENIAAGLEASADNLEAAADAATNELMDPYIK